MVKKMLFFIKVNFGFDGDKNHWHKATSVLEWPRDGLEMLFQIYK